MGRRNHENPASPSYPTYRGVPVCRTLTTRQGVVRFCRKTTTQGGNGRHSIKEIIMRNTNTMMPTSLYSISGTDYNAVVISYAHNNPEWNIILNTCRHS